MLEEKFKRIIDLFRQSIEDSTVDLEKICREAIEFFEHLKGKLQNGTETEKKEALRIMNEVSSEMNKQIRLLQEKMGATEEQMRAFAENPSNFSPEQWRLMQETKDKLSKDTKALIQLIKGKSTGLEKRPKEEEKKKGTKPKKSGWLRM